MDKGPIAKRPIPNKIGNYIRVDTTTSDDKNYLNQQPKQLVSYLSLASNDFFNNIPRTNAVRGKENKAWCQQVYKSLRKACSSSATRRNLDNLNYFLVVG